MNKLRLAIESCMSSFESGGTGELAAVFTFPPEFPGFQGHFPGNPVLPAVCILQAVMVMAAHQAGHSVELKKISSAKWFAPTGPDSALSFQVHLTPAGDGGGTIRARISRSGDKVADLTLMIEGLGTKGGSAP